MCKAEEEAIPT